jgi:hypothetical protein
VTRKEQAITEKNAFFAANERYADRVARLKTYRRIRAAIHGQVALVEKLRRVRSSCTHTPHEAPTDTAIAYADAQVCDSGRFQIER